MEVHWQDLKTKRRITPVRLLYVEIITLCLTQHLVKDTRETHCVYSHWQLFELYIQYKGVSVKQIFNLNYFL